MKYLIEYKIDGIEGIKTYIETATCIIHAEKQFNQLSKCSNPEMFAKTTIICISKVI